VLKLRQIATQNGSYFDLSWVADVVDMAGNELTIPTITTSGVVNNLCTYEGKVLSATNAPAAKYNTNVDIIGVGQTITTGTSKLGTLSNSDDVYLANGQTKFVYVNADGTIKIYNGIDSVPTYNIGAGQAAYAVESKSLAGGAFKKVANIVFITGQPGDVTSVGVVYYLGSYNNIAPNKYTFDVIKDGKRETLTASDVTLLDSLGAGELMFGGLLFGFQIDNGVVKGYPGSSVQTGSWSPAPASVTSLVRAETTSIEVKGGLIYYGGAPNGDRVRADTTVYQFTQIFNTYTQDKGLTELDILKFPVSYPYGPFVPIYDGTAYTVYNNAAHDQVVAIYIILPNS